MVEIVWEFIVKDGAQGKFELVFGPGGAWGNLYAPCLGFRGTTVMRDTGDPRRYLAVEVWDTEVQRDASHVGNKTQAAVLETTLDQLTVSRTEIGTFSVLAQAGVRPLGKTRRSRKR